ncbi:MAG TPA: hypothetical protein VFA21_10175 [Pyrinomonadaceae bacterium]|nr:hypothetical protein [Pyrinomonadaceae bacterium]
MKRRGTFLSLTLAFTFLFGTAFLCGQSNSRRASDNQVGGLDDYPDEASSNAALLPDLVSTNWSEVSLTRNGEPEYRAGTYPNLQFCRDGSWAIHHYGGASDYELEGGKYQVSGSHVVMQNEDGTSFGDFHLVSRTDEELLLESDDGYVMRLKYLGRVNC